MAIRYGQTPVLTPGPPRIPANMDPTTANYMRAYSLWVMNGLSARLPASQALPGILVQANDTPSGSPPQVFAIEVDSTGTLSVTAQPLGKGSP